MGAIKAASGPEAPENPEQNGTGEKMKSVLVDIDGPLATITMNRPERRNGMDLDMVHAMHDTLATLATRRDVTVVILTGAGDHFCVGADIGGTEADPEAVTHRRLAPAYHSTTLLHTMPQVTIAAIGGGCAGAGLGWAAACDLRFASDRARFSTAFLNVGVAGDMGAAWVVQQAVGPARARELFLFPEKFGAEDALRFHLVTRIFPAATLLQESRALALQLAGRSAYALEAIKANFVAAERLSLEDFIELEGARHMHLIGSRESTAAFEAFAGRAGTV
ncbi:2-(1,2-epoxy-1,2-dihydrophenyl)acetyl-CoA isomerase [Sphingobium wenxiniae]|uniref:2-(1,2-epoxy-1,2-dihydrophenyl)acetyl-CoA isomerase n=2 Tax=Sphingobium wenxiniae (strain DSM 21828 / CGMCC 1.7748 / JZ-1) TaxID=595605 RepID=A0A562K7W9_SPHWJ|nr:2-(1,2-epoxy-1,2-dihydrophenyl)acetyl-CoA isomerase [Sphingobium wenxiniae]